MREYYRTFIGIPVHREINRRIDRWFSPVAAEAGLRPVVAENRHLTLAFLGETPVEQIAPVAEALKKRFSRGDLQPEALLLAGLGVFPAKGVPRVFWTGVRDGQEWLKRVHDAVWAVLDEFGYVPEKRSFSPHLTLARVKAKSAEAVLRQVDAGSGLEFGSWLPDSAVFYSSVREKSGMFYSALATLPF